MALSQLLIIFTVGVAYTLAATYIIVPVPDTTGYRGDTTLMKRWGGLNFKKPSFWSALTNRDDEQGEHHAILDSHLLPEHILHEEFLKPQLQAAGFKGGKIIAGPFPVPLSKLPKPHGLLNPNQPAAPVPKQSAPSNAIYAVNKPSYKPVPPASSAPYQPTVQFSLVKPSAVSYHKAPYNPAVFKPSLAATYQPVKSTSSGVGAGISSKQAASESGPIKLVYGGWAPIYDNIARENDAQVQAVNNEEPAAVTKEQTNPEAAPLPASRRTAKSAKNVDKGQTFVAPIVTAEENQGSQTEDIVTASSVHPVEIGRGQGRFVGRVLSGSVREARDDVVTKPKWQKTNENFSLSSVGYTIRFAERR